MTLTVDAALRAGAPPIIAILRGIRSDEVMAVGEALIAAGLRIIEVPLNSPDPFVSIRKLQESFGETAAIGAGTVLTEGDVDRLAETGAHLMVAPNTEPAVIKRAIVRGLEPVPGFATPSEAFTAIRSGARRLKLFPAGSIGLPFLKGMREVLPKDVSVWATGGVGASNLAEWLDAGAQGIGVGGALYRPGDSTASVGEKAKALATVWRNIRGAR